MTTNDPHNTDDPFTTWDAGYVLGALSPADRRIYQAHLAECDNCSNAVNELAGVPGLLALVPRETALSMIDDDVVALPPPPPDGMLPRLVAKAERTRRRSRWITAGVGIAAAAAAVAIAVPVARIGHDSGGGTAPTVSAQPFAARTMTNLIASPLSADFTLTPSADGGTRVDLECRYDAGAAAYTGKYEMYVTDASGVESQLATWTAKPGDVVTPSATISTAPGNVRSVDIRSSATEQVILLGTV
ncbi:zf-HC2 domain-containing protein [Antrihabitans cavernicola]|uniref:Zf-HC2 domain-containing protein n=1 Tax=Antrihabitans cavernicola TaxID=2495913 RepID=A0A5A7SGM9_9NOCA|nr:zf-HC2 domain-containing protein [Spelaeibacter cavernicola]KAA0024996.1 zf-HC2 domain-containing protein [Spelaeibacter cavernicola]